MDIRELRHILAVAESGTLSRAAERLSVSRQAVAKTLRGAEAEVGAPLFERTGATLVPTARGEALIREARGVVAAFDELCQHHLRCPRGVASKNARETLSIALVTGGRDALPDRLLERYTDACPQVTLNVEEMSTDAVLVAVERGAAEIGIVGTHPTLIGNLEFELIRRIGVWVYLPADHHLARQQSVALPDLSGLPLVTAGEHNHVHRFVALRCSQLGIQLDVLATTTDTTLLGHLVYEHRAACFGFPPQVKEPPHGFVARELAIEGGEAFGTYLVRRPTSPELDDIAGRAGEGSASRARLSLTSGKTQVNRAARRFWVIARALGERDQQKPPRP